MLIESIHFDGEEGCYWGIQWGSVRLYIVEHQAPQYIRWYILNERITVKFVRLVWLVRAYVCSVYTANVHDRHGYLLVSHCTQFTIGISLIVSLEFYQKLQRQVENWAGPKEIKMQIKKWWQFCWELAASVLGWNATIACHQKVMRPQECAMVWPRLSCEGCSSKAMVHV